MSELPDWAITLNIYATPGTRVRYTGLNGYDADKEHANKYLVKGNIYTVRSIDISSWGSKVEFEEGPGLFFNTVHFKEID